MVSEVKTSTSPPRCYGVVAVRYFVTHFVHGLYLKMYFANTSALAHIVGHLGNQHAAPTLGKDRVENKVAWIYMTGTGRQDNPQGPALNAVKLGLAHAARLVA